MSSFAHNKKRLGDLLLTMKSPGLKRQDPRMSAHSASTLVTVGVQRRVSEVWLVMLAARFREWKLTLDDTFRRS